MHTTPLIRTANGSIVLRGREPIYRNGVRILRQHESVTISRY